MLWTGMPKTAVNEYGYFFLGEHYIRVENATVCQPNCIVFPESKPSVME